MPEPPLTELGLIGCGAIGSAVVNAVIQGELSGVKLVGILDRVPNTLIDLAREQHSVPWVTTLPELLALRPNLIMEAAGHAAVLEYSAAIVAHGVNFLPMSVGAFAANSLLAELMPVAQAQGSKILISSGAVGALDVLRASRAGGGLDEVLLTSTKRPAALVGQPYLVEHGINLEGLAEPKVIFDGTASEACLAFPKSTNIAASVSLAGIGFERTRVRMMADPTIQRTTHTLVATGSFGELRLTLQNLPHPANASTTYLACQGAIAALQNSRATLCFV